MKKIFSLILCSVMALAASATSFTKVTTAPDDWSGQYIIVAEDTVGTGAKVFTCVDASQNFVAVNVDGDSIVSEVLNNYVVTIAPMQDGYSIKAGTQYMGGNSSKNTIAFSAAPLLNTVQMTANDGVLLTSETSVLRFNSKSTITGGNETGIRFRYYKATSYTNHMPIQLYRVNGEVEAPTVDTIGVTEARERIEAGNLISCYVKGVVATKPSDPGSYGNTIFWMTDIDNATDSLEGYRIAGIDGASFATKDSIPFGVGDTILVYASALALYNNSIYEINGGNYAAMLGKASFIILPFTYAEAIYHGIMTPDYEYSLILRASESELPMAELRFKTPMEHGIAGRYNNFHAAIYSSGYQDQVSMENVSLYLTYAGISANDYNLYEIVLTFALEDELYRYEGNLEVAGYTEDYESPYALTDDRPYIPQAGDTLTCAQAKEYTLTLDDQASTEFEVTVIGYVTDNFNGNVSRGQQSFWLDDVKDSGKKTFQGYYCNLPDQTTPVPVGAKLAITGKLMRYGSTPEMKNGSITYLEGEPTPEERELNILPVPENAITVAEALEIGAALENGGATEEEYTVVGYICKVQYQTKNDTASWYMLDTKMEAESFSDFEAYKCAIDNNIMLGDYVFVTGQLTKYVGEKYTTIEIKYGEAHFAEERTAIENATVVPAQLNLNEPMYNTLGQQVDASFRGIVIQNGQKYLLY